VKRRALAGLVIVLAGTSACATRGGAPPRAPSPAASARRLAATSIRFFAFGDGGTGAPDQYRVAAAVEKKCAASGCDFGILLGDNVYPDGVTSADDPQWTTKFEEPYARLLARGIPFYAVLGNHDYADGADLARGAFQVAYAAGHPQWRMPAEHYTFEQGPARFIALDTQKIVANDRESAAAQSTMVEQALKNKAGAWLIGLGHHPYVSNGVNGNAGRLLSAFLEDRLCRGADLYLTGHDHNLQVLQAPEGGPCRSLFVVAGGGGYDTYALGGTNPALFQSQSLGFAYVTVEATRLTIEMIDADGTSLFSTKRVK
jgi:tartrate-resistant acid phosphatase type 5